MCQANLTHHIITTNSLKQITPASIPIHSTLNTSRIPILCSTTTLHGLGQCFSFLPYKFFAFVFCFWQCNLICNSFALDVGILMGLLRKFVIWWLMGFWENLEADVLLATCLQLLNFVFTLSQGLLFSSFAACWY